MPLEPIESLPDDSKTWVFSASEPLDERQRARLGEELPRFLRQWTAHGAPVPAAWSLDDERFLIVAADERQSPSGCSIDALFRFVGELGQSLGVDFLSSGDLFYRDARGKVRSVSRDRFRQLAHDGEIGPSTSVIDPSIDTLGRYRHGFEQAARESWHSRMLPATT